MDLNSIFSETQSILGKPYHDLSFLLESLKEVLIENGESEMSCQIPLVNDKIAVSVSIGSKHLQMYSLVFQLINLCEINGAVQYRRSNEGKDLGQVNGLFANQIGKLKMKGLSDEENFYCII